MCKYRQFTREKKVDGAIRENTVDEIKSRCNIVDIIGGVVQLKKAGSNYKGLCPFHKEKTPSFVVSEEKQIYTCFGCGATGDVIEFVQKYYNLDFPEALQKLADSCGMTIESSYAGAKNKDELYSINKEAATFFFRAFHKTDSPAYEYMKKRGINDDVLKKFGIGYADTEWDSLYKHLKEKGFPEEKLIDLGLISSSKGKYFDKFRNRVIFPIINTRGKVIGFGGRTIGEDMPKYLNSKESSVFLKKNNLYGLSVTRSEMTKTGYAVLVEGYMDVISLYQRGICNVAASLGTALTENQAKLLKRYVSNVVLSYDSDEAGRKAAFRGMDILHREEFKVKIPNMQEAKDPDDFIKAKGRSAFIKIMKEALPYADYKIAEIKKEVNMKTTEGRVDFLKKAVEVLKTLGPVEADIYIKKLAAETGISEGAIRAEMDIGKENKKEENLQPGEDRENKTKGKAPVSRLEKNAIKLMLEDESFINDLIDYSDMFQSVAGKNIFEAISSLSKKDEKPGPEKLSGMLEPEDADVLKDIQENIILAGKEEEVLKECIRAYHEAANKKREKELIMMISMANEEENSEEIKKLTEELMEIQKKNRNGGK